MKTVNYIFAVLTFAFISLNSLAGNTPSSGINTSIINEIKNHVSLGTTKSGEMQKVTFTFTVNDNGNVNAVAAKVENKARRQALEAQFAKLSFKGLSADTTYNIDVNFINY